MVEIDLVTPTRIEPTQPYSKKSVMVDANRHTKRPRTCFLCEDSQEVIQCPCGRGSCLPCLSKAPGGATDSCPACGEPLEALTGWRAKLPGKPEPREAPLGTLSCPRGHPFPLEHPRGDCLSLTCPLCKNPHFCGVCNLSFRDPDHCHNHLKMHRGITIRDNFVYPQGDQILKLRAVVAGSRILIRNHEPRELESFCAALQDAGLPCTPADLRALVEERLLDMSEAEVSWLSLVSQGVEDEIQYREGASLLLRGPAFLGPDLSHWGAYPFLIRALPHLTRPSHQNLLGPCVRRIRSMLPSRETQLDDLCALNTELLVSLQETTRALSENWPLRAETYLENVTDFANQCLDLVESFGGREDHVKIHAHRTLGSGYNEMILCWQALSALTEVPMDHEVTRQTLRRYPHHHLAPRWLRVGSIEDVQPFLEGVRRALQHPRPSRLLVNYLEVISEMQKERPDIAFDKSTTPLPALHPALQSLTGYEVTFEP